MKRLVVCAMVMLLAGRSLQAAERVTLQSLLREMVDVESIARWPVAEFTCQQASSHDRATVAPDKPGWFANDDHTQFIRVEEKNGRREQVMLDAAGPGALVRFWLTAGGPRQGTMRVYLDHAESPSLTFSAFDLLQSDLKIGEPLVQPHPGYGRDAGGSNFYLPIPYSKHCKVTWEEKGNGARYYVINYRSYAPETPVETFQREQVSAAAALIAQVNEQLAHPRQFAAGTVTTWNDALPALDRKSIALPAGAAAVRRLELRLEADNRNELEQALRSVIVQLEFDGEVTAWCPATDFFGSGVGINELQSWYRTVSKDGAMSCRWVMPYQREAKITLHNLGRTPIRATLHATTSPWEWDERSMHFHASWHHESDLKTPPLRDWNYVTLKGRGVYVGDTLSLFNPVATWYGEGDEKISVDGEAVPSHLGTGTEDYYGYSYAPRGIIQTPFCNQIRVDDPKTQGHNVLTRCRNLDGIPFRKSLQFDIELISWAPTTLSYAATTYWYAFPGATSNVAPQPANAIAHVPTLEEARESRTKKIAGAIECESLKIISKTQGLVAEPQDMSPWDSANWSKGHHLVVKPRMLGEFIELEIPASDELPRELTLYATEAPDFGILKFTVNGQESPATVDLWAANVQPAKPVTIGTFKPDKGRYRIRVEVTGANPKSAGPRYFFGLDCFVLSSAK